MIKSNELLSTSSSRTKCLNTSLILLLPKRREIRPVNRGRCSFSWRMVCLIHYARNFICLNGSPCPHRINSCLWSSIKKMWSRCTLLTIWRVVSAKCPNRSLLRAIRTNVVSPLSELRSWDATLNSWSGNSGAKTGTLKSKLAPLNVFRILSCWASFVAIASPSHWDSSQMTSQTPKFKPSYSKSKIMASLTILVCSDSVATMSTPTSLAGKFYCKTGKRSSGCFSGATLRSILKPANANKRSWTKSSVKCRTLTVRSSNLINEKRKWRNQSFWTCAKILMGFIMPSKRFPAIQGSSIYTRIRALCGIGWSLSDWSDLERKSWLVTLRFAKIRCIWLKLMLMRRCLITITRRMLMIMQSSSQSLKPQKLMMSWSMWPLRTSTSSL